MKKLFIILCVLLINFSFVLSSSAATIYNESPEEDNYSVSLMSDFLHDYPSWKEFQSMKNLFPKSYHYKDASYDETFLLNNYLLYFDDSRLSDDGSSSIAMIAWDSTSHKILLNEKKTTLWCYPTEGGDAVYRMFYFYWDGNTWVDVPKRGYKGYRSMTFTLGNEIYLSKNISHNVEGLPVILTSGISSDFEYSLQDDEDYEFANLILKNSVTDSMFGGLFDDIFGILPVLVPVLLAILGVRRGIVFVLNTVRSV